MSTVRLHGHPYALTTQGHVTTWDALPPPTCPECSEYLSAGCADDERTVSIYSDEWAGTCYVECDGCSALFPIDAAPALSPNREQADGYYEPSIVEDEAGDDRS